MLHCISEATLSQFLDSRIKEFQLVQTFKGLTSGPELVVWRKGGKVMVRTNSIS